MHRFVLAYRQPIGYKPTAETMGAWRAWFDGMGDQLVDLGNPAVARVALGDCGRATELGGFSVIEAEDLAAATSIAKGCPHLARGGGIEVGLLGQAPSASPANEEV